MANNNKASKAYWLDNPKNVTLIVWALVVFCTILFFLDGFYHKHTHFNVEHLFGFYGIYGFFVCVALVLVAKALRQILMRSEDYYDHQEEERNNTDARHYDHE